MLIVFAMATDCRHGLLGSNFVVAACIEGGNLGTNLDAPQSSKGLVGLTSLETHGPVDLLITH